MNIEIRTYRKERGWTQVEFAGRLGVQQATVSKLERGQVGISRTIARRLHRLDPQRFSLERLFEFVGPESEDLPNHGQAAA